MMVRSFYEPAIACFAFANLILAGGIACNPLHEKLSGSTHTVNINLQTGPLTLQLIDYLHKPSTSLRAIFCGKLL